MSPKSLILPFRPTVHTHDPERFETTDRRPTAAEREFVRARARQAARALFEAELHESAVTPDGISSCE